MDFSNVFRTGEHFTLRVCESAALGKYGPLRDFTRRNLDRALRRSGRLEGDARECDGAIGDGEADHTNSKPQRLTNHG